MKVYWDIFIATFIKELVSQIRIAILRYGEEKFYLMDRIRFVFLVKILLYANI